MDSDYKEDILTEKQRRVLIFTSTIFNALLIIVSFLLPPVGIIDNSVLIAVGELSLFVTIHIGISTGWGKLSIRHKDTEIEIHKKDGE